MAFTNLRYGFYNYDANDTDPKEYDAEDVGMIFDGIITDGIYENYKNGMVVKASTDPYCVIIRSGRAWFDHTWSYIDTDTILDMSGSDYSIVAPYKRIDAIVLDVDTVNRVNKIDIVKGTEVSSGTPVKPTLINEAGHVQHGLAFITREGGVSIITQDKIEDARGHAAYNSAFVTGVLSQMTIDDIVAQWDTEFNSWNEAQRESFLLWRAERESEFIEWFNGVKDQLDSDAAGHLQNEIESIRIRSNGVASADTVAYKEIGFNEIPSTYIRLPGSEYMEQAVMISANSSATVTFSNSIITPSSAINVFTNTGINYDDISITNERCRITFSNNWDGTLRFNVRIYIS